MWTDDSAANGPRVSQVCSTPRPTVRTAKCSARKRPRVNINSSHCRFSTFWRVAWTRMGADDDNDDDDGVVVVVVLVLVLRHAAAAIGTPLAYTRGMSPTIGEDVHQWPRSHHAETLVNSYTRKDARIAFG